ncbi:terpenoid synthase [Lactarius deliciosus]|nr:terpenoid synthase [Lactarius deliciosus]
MSSSVWLLNWYRNGLVASIPTTPRSKQASSAWLRSIGVFSPKAQEAYDRYRLAALGCPLQDKAGLRIGCDLVNVLFVFDEYMDVAREEEVQVMDNIGMDDMRNPHKPRPKVERENRSRFWKLVIKTASAQTQKRFIETFDAYLQAVVQEAADRFHKHIRNIQDYLAIRRDTTASKLCFAVLEFDMKPDEAVHHPVIEELYILSIDMILLSNDIASSNLEQVRGDDNHNIIIITTVMHHNKTDIQGAMNWVDDYHKELEAKFTVLYENKIPKFGEPVDTELAQYVEGLGNWRYFGKTLKLKKNTMRDALPKGRSEDIGLQLVDDPSL